MKRFVIIFIFLIRLCEVIGQNDSLPYTLYRDNLILHTSIGINDAPFRLNDDFGQVNNLRYRANLNAIMGIGINYKWFALNFNFKLPGYLRSRSQYGETNYFDLGFSFEVKKWFFAMDIHGYNGFGLINADRISKNLEQTEENVLINDQLRSFSFSMNGYRFKNEEFKIKPAVGIAGRYHQPASTFYMKYTLNIHGIGSTDSIMPHSFFEIQRSLYRSHNISAFDLGVVPGWAYSNNNEGWQFGFLAGLGAVIQAKVYNYDNTSRGFLGLAPRLDLKFQFGYNVDNWFLMLTSSFDNKSIRFNDFRYSQNYYYLRLSYGYRFPEKK
ncbi:MAG: DUF4421 family protein [Brumimicrobium sp.]|nr:DUF4421 family protein [Brumimicrobium sp.]